MAYWSETEAIEPCLLRVPGFKLCCQHQFLTAKLLNIRELNIREKRSANAMGEEVM